MITIAPKSSIMANAVRKTFKETGTLLPNKDKTPSEKAMSVAEGKQEANSHKSDEASINIIGTDF